MIEVEGLRKLYGDLVAVDGVSFSAGAGEIFGLLGPNGAGKSTTISCMSGLLTPTEGRVRIMGHDIVREPLAAKQKLGIVPQEMALYEDLSARDNLAYWAAAYGMSGAPMRERVDAVLESVGLLDRAGDPPKEYSGGMKRRLNFACGIVHEPKVVLLDEPTAGVDPQSRARLLDLVRELAAGGACVLYTTHYMEEAQALCDNLAIIDHGKLIAMGTLTELRALVGERDLVRVAGQFEPEQVAQELARLSDVEVLTLDEAAIMLAVKGAAVQLPSILQALTAGGGQLRETTFTEPSLETLFMKLTGRDLRE